MNRYDGAFRYFLCALALLLAGSLTLGCGGDDAEESTDLTGGTSSDLDGAALDGESLNSDSLVEGGEADAGEGGESGGACSDPTGFTDDFLVVYGLRGRVPGVNQDEFELYVVNSTGGNPVNPDSMEPLSVTEFSLQGSSFQWCADSEPWDLSCQKGCTVDDGLNWIAVGVPVPSASQLDPNSDEFDPALACLLEVEEAPLASDGFSVWLGQLGSNLKANMLKGAVLKNLAHFSFKGGKMYYSKKAVCIGPSCTYNIFMRDLSVNVNEEIKLLEFPPGAEELDGSVYKGYFHLSEDGEMLAFLNPTIRSQSYWTWTKGTLHMLKRLCQAEDNGKCTGTGSHYSDRDPVAISPEVEHATLVTTTISESNQRAWKYKTNAEGEPQWSNIVTTPPGTDYWTSVCTHMSDPWHYAFTEGLQFTPEGDSVVYLGRSECNGVGLKSETDILEMPIALIGSGKPIEENDIFNITQNPKTSTASNIVLGSFDLCPNGQVIVATGSPSVDADGKPLDDENQATMSDRELYLFSRDGCTRKQMTKSVSYEVNSVQCVPNPYTAE